MEEAGHDAADDAAAVIAALDAILLRPGEVYTEDWEGYAPRHDPPPIYTEWQVVSPEDRVNAHVESTDNWHRAWDAMRAHPEFDRWYLTHQGMLGGDTTGHENDVVFQDRGVRSLRVSHVGNLVYRVPYTDVWDAEDEVIVLAGIIWRVLQRRAEVEGLTPPPAIEEGRLVTAEG